MAAGRRKMWAERAKGRQKTEHAPAPIATETSRLSSTVSSGNRLFFWKLRVRPARARASGGIDVTSRPSIRTRPASGASSPDSRLKSVVLPEPFGPTIAWRAPRGNVREMPRATSRAPNDLHSPSALNIAPLPRQPRQRAVQPLPGAPHDRDAEDTHDH